MCHLCADGQGDYTPDPWTEARKTEVLAQLRAALLVEAVESEDSGPSIGRSHSRNGAWPRAREADRREHPAPRSIWRHR